MSNNKYKTVAILHNAEEAIKYCSATLKLKVILTQGVPPTCVSLVLGFRKHFCPPKGFRKEKKVEKHCLRVTYVKNPKKLNNMFDDLNDFNDVYLDCSFTPTLPMGLFLSREIFCFLAIQHVCSLHRQTF